MASLARASATPLTFLSAQARSEHTQTWPYAEVCSQLLQGGKQFLAHIGHALDCFGSDVSSSKQQSPLQNSCGNVHAVM